MNYGNILSTTWKTIWKNKAIIWFGMLMIVAPALVGILFGGVLSFSSPGQIDRFFSSDPSDLSLIVFFFGYLFFIIFAFAMTALSFVGVLKGTLMAKDTPQSLTFDDLWKASLPYFWRMLGVMFSVGLMLGLVYFVPILFFALVGALTAGVGFLLFFVCMVPLVLIFIPVGIVGYLMLSLSMTALIAEDGTVFETIQSAWQVMRANFWPLVLMTVILYMIQFGVSMVIAIPINILQFSFMIPMASMDVDSVAFMRYFGVFLALVMPITSVLQGLTLTYTNSAWMLSYLDVSAISTPPVDSEDEIVEYAA